MSQLAPRPIFASGPLLGRGLFDALLARFGGATLLESLDAGDDSAPTAAWLAEEIARVERPRALIAHGLAGAVAIELAVTQPDAMDGLVVIGVGAETVVPAGRTSLVERLVAGAFTDRASPEATRARDALSELPEPSLAAASEEWERLDVTGRLGGVEIPLLVVAGGQDGLAPLAGVERLAQERASAGLAVLPGAAHGAPAEAPGAVALLVAAFLARLELSLTQDQG